MKEHLRQPADFDLSQVLLKAKPDYFDKVSWSEVPNYRLTQEAQTCLKYMARVEGHTPYYVRHPLASTRVMRDVETTDFLSVWPAQELWHGIALFRFMDIYNHGSINEQISSTRKGDTEEQRRSMNIMQRHGNLISALMAHLTPRHFEALYATIGATNELTTLHGYGRLAEVVDHPVLTNLLSYIRSEESNHFKYYEKLAGKLLEGRKDVQRFVRWGMKHFWSVVGEGYRPTEEMNQVVRYLFPEGSKNPSIAVINNTIARLPGLEEATFINDAADQALAA